MRARNVLPIVATSAVLALCCEELHATEITVVSSRGSVTVTQADHLVPVSASAHLSLPAQVRTGSDGMIDLRDNGSLVHIGPNSTVAIPESGTSGGLVDRYLQSAGSALYNIQGRHGRPLSVETPYLVSVVKGTVFTVSVEGRATSVTLMEGSLDVAAPDVSQHVLLKPNQSIRHSPGEPSLSVSPARAESALTHGSAKDVAPLAEEATSSQAAFVTRDLAEVGASVSAQHALSSSSLSGVSPTGPGANNGGSSGGGSTPGAGSAGTVVAGATSSGAGVPGAPSGSGSSSSPGSGGSASTGATSGPSSSTTSGSASNTGSTTDSGSSDPSGGDTSGGTAPVVGCNGKTNGTGQGKCLGHGKH